VRERISTPPDQIVIFTGPPGFCAWPILFQIEKVVVQRGVVDVIPRAGVYE
jgi:hypothetical protein